MPVRKTSIEAYEKILKEGLLSPRRWEIYATVFNHGPMTSAEAFAKINQDKSNIKVLTQSRARFTELREMGLLQELEPVICSITNNRVIQWDVTSNLPTKIIKPETKTKKIEAITIELEKTHLLITDIFERQSVADYILVITEKLKNLI
jgi:hypothetical protein